MRADPKVTLPSIFDEATAERLTDEYGNASSVLSNLLSSVEGIEFNSRDYYVREGAWPQAKGEFDSAVGRLAETKAYVDAVLEGICDGGHGVAEPFGEVRALRGPKDFGSLDGAPVLPSIHMNGTGKATLVRDYHGVVKRFGEAEQAIQAVSFNERDYHRREGAWAAARSEWRQAMDCFKESRDYFQRVFNGVAAGGHDVVQANMESAMGREVSGLSEESVSTFAP